MVSNGFYQAVKINLRKILFYFTLFSSFLGLSINNTGSCLRCFVCQQDKIQGAKTFQNESGRYISYLKFGFCKDGIEVGKLEECRYNHDGGGKYSGHQDVTPFCGYYIMGSLDRNEFYNDIEQKVDFGKIELFQKLFRGLYTGKEAQVDEYIYHSITQNTLKDFYILKNHTGVIRGCFGTQNFNHSKAEIQRGPGCHDIWKLGEEKKICLCNGIGGYRLDGCNNKKIHLKSSKKYDTKITSTTIPPPKIYQGYGDHHTTERACSIELNERKDISAANLNSTQYFLQLFSVIASAYYLLFLVHYY